MHSPIEVAKKYFDLSNESDLDEVKKLFSYTTTYSSQTTGIYLGVEDIISMQRDFHGKFEQLHWTVNSIEEVKPGIVLFDYDFNAKTKSGEEIHSSGYEYVIVLDGIIQHVEIRNK